VLSLDQGPLYGQGLCGEHPSDQQLALVKELRLDTVPVVMAKLTPKVRLIQLTHEFKEQFSRVWLARQWQFSARFVERIVCHSYFTLMNWNSALRFDVADQFDDPSANIVRRGA
jgi:hypothetical protein